MEGDAQVLLDGRTISNSNILLKAALATSNFSGGRRLARAKVGGPVVTIQCVVSCWMAMLEFVWSVTVGNSDSRTSYGVPRAADASEEITCGELRVAVGVPEEGA